MVRTMALTGLVTGAMILASGVYILSSTADDLYSSRTEQSLQDSARATLAAQRLIDSSDATDSGSLSSLAASVFRTVQDTSASQMIYIRRQPGQSANSQAPPDQFNAAGLLEVVSPDLSRSVVTGEELQYWQPVAFDAEAADAAGPGPGIVVASSLSMPAGVGTYDLFIGYNLADTEQTMGFIQRTLLLTAAFLMVLIGALVLVMLRTVFRPIRTAADTSRLLSEGKSKARMPLHNDEHFDMLSNNFNDMADTLQARIDELDELSEMQQRFVSDVSHELRTPLTTIRLASEVLQGQSGGLAPSQSRAVEVLGTQVERFEALLGDLLEISRYDAGRVTLDTEPTNIVPLTQEVVDGLQPLSSSIIEVRPLGGYTPVNVDARRMRRVISNLVGNAIEHGEGKAIVVTIDSNAQAIAISVRDWGVGMSAEAVERVFDRFWRADPSRKRTLGGTGLGLAIAREDAAVHGGLLEVWSRPGEGTNFRLTIPRGDDEQTFVSPLPLLPDGVADDETSPRITAGLLRRVKRRVKRRATKGEGK